MRTTRRMSRIPARALHAGFSIVELMIGIALGLVILAALTSFFVSTSSNRTEIERASRQIENGRFAIDTMRGELRLAGFYAEMTQAGATWTTPDPCAIPADFGFNMVPLKIPLPVYGYAADAPSFPSCATNRVADSDVLVIHRFNTEPVSPAAAATGASAAETYMQISRCATDSTATPWAMGLGSSTASFSLHKADCTTASDLYRLRAEIYYLRDYSTVVGDGVPTLVKVDVSAGQLRTSPLVEGIHNLRFAYGIDSSGDGVPETYKRCDTAAACSVADWSNVSTVRATVLAQNLENTINYTDTKVYDLGDGFSVGPLNDARKRHVYGAMVSLPNRTGPREN